MKDQTQECKDSPGCTHVYYETELNRNYFFETKLGRVVFNNYTSIGLGIFRLQVSDNALGTSITLQVRSIDSLKTSKKYTISSPDLAMTIFKSGLAPQDCPTYKLDQTEPSSLEFSEINLVEKRVRGRFNLTVINTCNEKVKISNGVFHVKTSI
jgi:hypothetical protein